MTTATLNKQAYPLMMHLSILPKYAINNEQAIYDATTQTSNMNAMAGSSWSSNSSSTGGFLVPRDSDSQEDD